jgi:hypothetical protein
MSNPETVLQSRIVDALGCLPGLIVMRNAQLKRKIEGQWVYAGLGPGSADLIICAFGLFVGMEVKTPTGKQSPDQIEWEQRITRWGGGQYVLVRSVQDALSWYADLQSRLHDPGTQTIPGRAANKI